MVTLQYVQPTQAEAALMLTYRDRIEGLYREIQELQNIHPRGKNLVLTKLEEAAMWLNKAITQNC